MHPRLRSALPYALALGALAPLALGLACGGKSGTDATTAGNASTGSVGMLVTDAPTDDWSAIGVVIRKVVLIPRNGTVADGVQIYDGATDGAQINLVHLDELAELLAKATGVPAQTYDRVVVTVDGNPSKITLVPAPDATGAPQAPIPASQIIVRGAKDANGWVALPTFNLETPLVVAAGASTALQLDFDLAHPLFIVVHDLVGTPVYTLNFQVRHKPFSALNRVHLRHFRGQVSSVAADGKSLVVRTEHGKDVTLQADASNKTLFYDLDATPVAANPSFTVPASLTAGKQVKASARFQTDGTLTAVRVWYAADDSRIPARTPEGHLVKVDPAHSLLRVLTEDGKPVTIAVDAATTFTFQGGATAIGTGPGFLANLGRGFKVHVTIADVLAVPMVATTVDIQRGVFEGNFTAASPTTGFTYSKTFGDASTESHALTYGTAFTWWNFAYPTLSSSDTASFAAKAMPAGGILKARGASTLEWGTGSGWAAQNAIFEPTQLSSRAQTITAPYAGGVLGVTYLPDGATATATATVNLATATGSQPLVYEYTRGLTTVTVTPLDASQWAAKLTANARVRVFGIPRADGSLDAYVINLLD